MCVLKIDALGFFLSAAFMNEPQDTQAVAGGSAMFTCTVESEEEFEITWSFNGETLQPGQKYNIPDDGTSLTITNIADADLGEYSCQVEDAGTGETIEASATLSLAGKCTLFVVLTDSCLLTSLSLCHHILAKPTANDFIYYW